jgi:ubiquinone/menaquinone biosynthesis C-methylase UbiE
MTQKAYGEAYGAAPAENYQRYFVPSIGAPVADDFIREAGLQLGQRVLDAACGTGVVTRLAAERVGAEGQVVGLDVNPGMLAVARSQTPAELPIDWFEASAESMLFQDGAFDVVLCQMGLQFIPNKVAALSEMRRVLVEGGRAIANMPGPEPALFAIMQDVLASHLGADAAGFVGLVFSLHDAEQIENLMQRAGFREIDVERHTKTLCVPPLTEFLWQYVNSTPIAEAAARAGEGKREAIERDICAQWQDFVVDGGMVVEVGMTTAKARK